MRKQIIGLLSIIVLITVIMSCSETTTPEPKLIVPKDTFTMTVDGVAWTPDSTTLIQNPSKADYYVGLAFKFKDKAKKQPLETYYFFIPKNAKAGETVTMPSKTYGFTSIEYGNDKGVAGNLTDDSRGSGEYKIVKSDGKVLTMTFSANLFIGNDGQIIKNGSMSLNLK